MPLLEVRDLSVRYGKALAVEQVSVTVDKGELVGVLGPNGAGKTTLLKAISRAIGSTGTLKFKGETLERLPPYDVVARGICHCPEGRRLFPELSVLKNLQLGAYLRSNKAEIAEDLERVFALFPVLKERQQQQSSTLSGGEQQMVAIGRAMMGRPELLLLDEPSVGIAPRLKGLIFDAIEKIRKDGTAILIVEQDATATLRIADRVYVLEHGRTVREGRAKELAGDEYIRQVYLGV
ncbi:MULTISPECIES: ABC transporter ATP-binding protein [Bradyrhizobium]|uniref:ABC transporter ATP-binding protein n=1 Tax=Bradyrhizobium TaxID=374 RepID=UPI0003FEEC0E|nr:MULTISPECIES: ABC transporter ATP-binding protein [Bradyrhizobium]MBO4226281.1 ATP-binding cassette domain-containing protein [Bradyrhizobium neotropicale]RZN31370.1 ABC transporter ATP-binding protein [Bradyrhizobium sp. Leo121]